MPPRRALLVAAMVCAAVLWVAGPAGRLAVALPLLIFGPGYLVARPLLRGAPVEQLALPAVWTGLSLSLAALLYQWAAALALALAPPVLQALAAGVAIGVARAVWSGEGRGTKDEDVPAPASTFATGPRAATATNADATTDTPASFILRPSSVALLAILALTLWTRAEQIRDLAAPAWVDALHHALLARVAAERGQAPYTLAPYLPVEPLTYHSGYHAFLAVLLRVIGAAVPGDLPWVMLWVGQGLNALQGLAWAGAAAALFRRPASAPAAALVVGLVSVMPAFYVSWGRYTLLAGTLMLPAVIVATLALVRTRGRGPLAACALLFAGLSLVHFVMLCFALCWCAALLITHGRREATLRVALSGGAALALTAPWLVLLLGEVRLGSGASAMSAAGNPSYNAMPEGLLWSSTNRLLLALAAAGGLVCVWRRARAGAALLLWAALATLLANPVLIGLPYLSFITNESLAITLFGPVSLLIAGGWGVLDAAVTAMARRHAGTKTLVRTRALAGTRVLHALSAVGMLGIAVWGAGQMRTIVRPDTVLATAADLRAIDWAAEHTPPEARFVVGTAGWLYQVDRGADGGWWLLPLAGRQVSTPPVVYTYGPDAFVAEVQRETAWLRSEAGRDPEALAAFMRAGDYGYVYTTGRDRSLDQAALRASPRFAPVLQDGDVVIFALAP